jgi:predicted RNA-binding protein YlqC (UPF0109 family)
MPESITFSQPNSNSDRPNSDRPNYEELVRFLIKPLLDSPDSLSIHCEVARSNERVLIRVAFGEDEQGGRVFGRGGRNIDAIRTTLEAAAQASGQSARLEIFGESHRDYNSNGSRYNDEDGDRRRFKKPYTVRPPAPTRRHSFRRKRSSDSRINGRTSNDEW